MDLPMTGKGASIRRPRKQRKRTKNLSVEYVLDYATSDSVLCNSFSAENDGIIQLKKRKENDAIL